MYIIKNFYFYLHFLPKLCGCPPIEKFLPKTLWVPGPRGPGVPHSMLERCFDEIIYLVKFVKSKTNFKN